MQDPTLDRSFRGHRDVITDLSFKPSMTQIASGSMDNSVMVWNFKPQMRAFRDRKGDVTVFKAHTSTVRTVRFSHDGESFLTCSDDKSIKIWSAHRAKFQFTLAGHMNWVRTARYSPDSKLVISGGDDKSVKLWDLASKNCIKTYWDHTGMVTSTAFHPSGTIIATASTDKSIKLFDIRTHKLIQHYHDAHVGLGPAADTKGGESAWAGGGPNSVNFGGPGGNWLISTGMDGVVKIWDLKEGHLFYTLHGHKNGPTTAAVFSPEGAFFATGGSDSQVMVWKSNFDAGVPLNADDLGAKYKTSTGGLATHVPHPIHTEPTTQTSFFSVRSKSNHLTNTNPVLDSVKISQRLSGPQQQRKLASMNSNLITTLPTSNSGGKKSPVSVNVKGYEKQAGGGDELAGVHLEADQPEIVSIGGPLLNRVVYILLSFGARLLM
ncbi:UNVERIFIED_CONTAM: POC1 centriolar protein A [Siphonaria sp. JEL0065]|nr:POC1 centriolar protein A [Siphonaria sp. JEL0065]